jgi:UDP-glucose:(heptosyl)LPS alpha-1,3-glucosyltransferase
MRFAFGIAKLFPGGGLQRDCVQIARCVQQLGHEVTIFTSRFRDGEFATGLNIKLLTNELRTNHCRQRRFSEDFSTAWRGKFDLSVGFDRLAGLDVLYCADPSILARVRQNWHLYVLRRYRVLIELERQCFERGKLTHLLLQDAHQLTVYQRAWSTELDRMTLLPPTIARDRQRPEFRSDGTRENIRRQLALLNSAWTWITIQVQPRTKGLDRILNALHFFPSAHLLIVGLHAAEKVAQDYARLAHKLGIEQQVQWLGHREDIPELLSAADVLVHPARYDTTGNVILEAILNEVPVITTDACGFAEHVKLAEAGIVLPESFDFGEFRSALEHMRDNSRCQSFTHKARQYRAQQQFNAGKVCAAKLIVDFAKNRSSQILLQPNPGLTHSSSLPLCPPVGQPARRT